MPRHKYKKVSSKPSNDVRNMVDAIKEVTLENRTLRSIAEKYKVGRSRLQRYISRIEAANLDPATVPDEQLFEFVSSLSDRVGGKTVGLFSRISFIISFIFSNIPNNLFASTDFQCETREEIHQIYSRIRRNSRQID